MTRVLPVLVVGLALFTPGRSHAQGQAAPRVEVQVPPTLREAAPIDLTGYWVAVGTEDWRYRWLVAERGDQPGIPVTAKGREVADDWDPSADEAAGLQCKAYGAAGLMRLPGRLHITWQDDNTLRIDTDTGQQTRLLTFGAAAPPAAERSWQGFSAAVWQASSRTGGQLKVRTTNLRAGYLRKNGAPYSENLHMTEFFTRAVSPNGDQWLVITNIVEDPVYLNERFITSSHFKKEADNARWSPTVCNTREPR